ncbi:MAG TPA: ATP-binding protein, partial [Terriglobales bacterium]|nr:ATP-binding protein [Terriglobales bacterium]
EELRRSEAFLAQGQRISHTGSWRWHVTTGIIDWSEETFRIFGANPNTEKPAYSLFMERVHPEDRAQVEAILNRAVQDKSDFDFDYRIVLSNGLIKFLRSVGQLMVSSSGELEFIGTVMDITESKRSEEQQREAQEQLAHVTRVVTLGELAGSIAHEVNQPLTAIINNADACLALMPGEMSKLDDVREALSDIISDADRASAVLARIRGLIKKSPPQKSRLDLNETIGGVIALTRGELDRNEVLLRTELANDLPIVMGDRIHLQQVILNLVINGIEAMRGVTDAPRELWISSKTVSATPGLADAGQETRNQELATLPVLRSLGEGGNSEQACILVSVADSGPGLDLNNLSRLFDAFYTTKPQGLGMGLSISRSLNEAHGGRLWARANAPKGALFQFTLPIGAE